ncbi:2-dehydropantoate 2-reductase [Vibrio genomosp. F10]|uniref:2-dehydropantoate 2-reductase n=1 Tax=Vibrio genomosp. F10 TaxID=723171 RepID=UPI00084BD411|nr:2-dehydropantoate 2-reductase [Vibrio genomosp. F10]OEE87017.1 2-dehydropantoate 2-reductase [Vibrio genomosp. F10 str. 9ZD137]
MNIVVLGPGAIGALWASHLNSSGHNVSLWSRSSCPNISIQLDDNHNQTYLNQHSLALNNADLLLVTVKSWQVQEALEPLLESLHHDCIILFMHNGMGAVDPLRSQLNAHPVLLATTTHGALKLNDTKVSHTGQGATQVGPYNHRGQQCQFMTDVLNHALPSVTWNDNITAALWQKLAINCAINPLTAIEQCRNGQLAGEPYQQRLNAIIEEVAQVIQAEGISLSSETLSSTVTTVIQATADNYSSMRQDIFYQRKTEIDFITGYLIDKAAQHRITTPENDKLYKAIKHIELSWTNHD